MFIFLDESYNLKRRGKKQFISINGFTVLDEKSLFKKWRAYRKFLLHKKRRIHATDTFFDKFRPKVLNLIERPDINLMTAFQVLQEIPALPSKEYFKNNKLNFDKIYLDLVLELLKKLNLDEYREVTITIDNRQYQKNYLGKIGFQKEVLNFLETTYSQTRFSFVIQPSTSNILLELADFISNIFYRAYLSDDEEFFKNLKSKIIQIKNPLK